MEVLHVSDRDAEPGAAPERGGSTVFQGSKALLPPRQVSLVVRRQIRIGCQATGVQTKGVSSNVSITKALLVCGLRTTGRLRCWSLHSDPRPHPTGHLDDLIPRRRAEAPAGVGKGRLLARRSTRSPHRLNPSSAEAVLSIVDREGGRRAWAQSGRSDRRC
jgi:hypothetical protein